MAHKCLACSGLIGEEQDEEMITGQVVRYIHTHHEDCQAELAKRSELGLAVRRDRLRQRKGRKPNLPGLDDMEKWG